MSPAAPMRRAGPVYERVAAPRSLTTVGAGSPCGMTTQRSAATIDRTETVATSAQVEIGDLPVVVSVEARVSATGPEPGVPDRRLPAPSRPGTDRRPLMRWGSLPSGSDRGTSAHRAGQPRRQPDVESWGVRPVPLGGLRPVPRPLSLDRAAREPVY